MREGREGMDVELQKVLQRIRDLSRLPPEAICAEWVTHLPEFRQTLGQELDGMGNAYLDRISTQVSSAHRRMILISEVLLKEDFRQHAIQQTHLLRMYELLRGNVDLVREHTHIPFEFPLHFIRSLFL